MSQPFFDRLAHVRAVIEAGPVACDYARDLKPYLVEEASIAYFFDALEDPRWLNVLSSEGLFTSIPEPQVDPVSGSVSHPAWPLSHFLARMAGTAPDKVLETILSLPETHNIRVVADVVAAARGMPANLAIHLVPRLVRWIESTYLLLPEEIGALACDLAASHQGEAAFTIMQALIVVLPPVNIKQSTDGVSGIPREPNTRIDVWSYEAITQKYVPSIVKAVGLRMFNLLNDLLDDAIMFSGYTLQPDNPRDYSYIWRPAVEEHPQNAVHGIKDVLVSAVRDAAVMIVASHRTPADRVVEILESRKWPIFHRIALHVLRQFPQDAKEVVARVLTNRTDFDSLDLRHEYTLLIRSCFDMLSEPQKSEILRWIDAGPTMPSNTSETSAQNEDQVSDIEVKRRVALWQRDWLERLGPSLPALWKRRSEELQNEFGSAEHPEFAMFIRTGWVSTTSPLTTDELRSMEVEAIIEYIETWRPPQGIMADPFESGPSEEGLARELTNAVAADPARFARKAALFGQCSAEIIGGVVRGFERGIEQKHRFQWSGVLRLCQNTILRSSQSPAQDMRLGANNGLNWREVRKAIAHLVSRGLQEAEFGINAKLRKRVWEVIRPLTDDPDPIPEEEHQFGPPNMRPYEFAINTVRGTAMHAVIDYALWIRRHGTQIRDDGLESEQRGWNNMPEARDVLDKHLDLIYEPSTAIRSVYGQRLPWLALIDRYWVSENLRRILPEGDEHRKLRDAAWEAYLVFCPPYRTVYQLVRNEYRTAVDTLDSNSDESSSPFNSNARLAEHLMTLFWQGIIHLDEPDGVMEKFYARAPESLRMHSLVFVGRTLYQASDEVPIEIIDRLKQLWIWRFELITRKPLEHMSSQELTAFGWWFGSAKFDDEWALAQLNRTLQHTARVDAAHLVIERLAETVAARPALTVECLGRMLANEGQIRLIPNWRHFAREILDEAIVSDTAQAREGARALINLLGSLGYLELGDLLAKERPNS